MILNPDNEKKTVPEPQLFQLIDTHCHLDSDALLPRLDQLLTAASKAGVTAYIIPGVHPDGWERISRIAAEHKSCYPAYGIHPMHADSADEEVFTHLEEIASQGIAIGEIGLDSSYTVPIRSQEYAFRRQLRIALKYGLPVLIHCRYKFMQLLQILKEEQAYKIGGIMHAYSGSPEMAREFIKLGFTISIAGPVTWPNSVNPPRLAVALPLESLVLETDSPDMPPQSCRGEANQPANLVEILGKIAQLRGMSPEVLAAAILNNTLRTLGRLSAC
jgi:TatD DNase family protein